MGRNRNFVNSQRGFLQNILAYYLEPKQEVDIVNDVPNFRNMTTKQIQDYYEKRELFTSEDNMDYISKEKRPFYCKDGTTNVYTKRGFDIEIDEILDRQLIEIQMWRLQTTNTSIDFKSGGRIYVGEKVFTIIKVINQISTETVQNKFFARRNMNGWIKLGIKLLVLV